MIKAEEIAIEIGQLDQLNRRDVIAEIAEGRMRHIAKKLWENDAALRDEENSCINFSHFKKLLYRWINILITRKTLFPSQKKLRLIQPASWNARQRVL